MVSQDKLKTLGGKIIFFKEKISDFSTTLDLNKCLKQIGYPRSHLFPSSHVQVPCHNQGCVSVFGLTVSDP